MIATLHAWCGGGAALGLGLPLAALLAGLVGGVTHCMPMCGPFVLGQVADRLACMPALCMRERNRAGAALLLPYHAGRLTTYALLGGGAGAVGAALAYDPVLRIVPSVLLLAAAGVFAACALVPATASIGSAGRAGQAVARLAARAGQVGAGRLGGGGTLQREYATGLALGLLPCGLLYGTLGLAAAAPGPAGGMLVMLVFGLGTVPALVLAAWIGQSVARRWQPVLTVARRPVLLADAAILAVIATARLV
ncbi:MAG TPA: sulfite exporter TauE/SafE family protein [Acidisphaera sp.]|nr:sulfite exporter TauE/SafE family protein [Acidisphaera sp.]